ncbi:MAG: preprotein translocase subunit SecY [Oscillospiraceae bacterium]|jgi:preprotein translocase subunit SecY|nr:preprotein translocase subunit SecY [Oscillospiraceae bacterium]
MLETLRNAWRIIDLRKKILFTLVILLLYRIGNAVPVPYIDVSALEEYFTTLGNTVFGLFNAMSGNAFSSATIFALSIQPYINASIIMQLLCIAIPALERIQKEGGEEGRKKIASITRYATVIIGLLQGTAYYMMVRNYNLLQVGHSGIWEAIVIVLSFTAGSALIMWLGEQVTEFGIGNGISIILFASIISRLPSAAVTMVSNVAAGGSLFAAVAIIVGVLVIIALIVFVSDAERRIGVQYAKRVVGRKMYGGQSTHLPMKVNMSGVMPIIFAQSIASLPATIMMFVNSNPAEGTFGRGLLNLFNTGSAFYIVLYFLLIIGFSFFYATVQFNPIEIANNLKNNGGFIPGFRPGRSTSDFIRRVLNKITLFGAIYLGLVAALPMAFGTSNMGLAMGGTSIIIVVGVALETVKALEAQLLMRNYKGFLE